MNRLVPCLFFSFSVAGCVPPESSAPEPAPAEKPAEGAIPWAAGEAPADGAASAREVGPEPRSHEIPDEPVKKDGIAVTPPSQVCGGRVPPLLRSAVQIRADETRNCYESVPEEKAGAAGEIRVQLQIGTNGSVEKLEIVEDTFGVPEATACIEKVLSKRFDTGPRGGCALFVVPVKLAAETADDAGGEAGAQADGAAEASGSTDEAATTSAP